MTIHFLRTILTILGFVSLLASCGGGGGSASTTVSAPTITTQPASQSVASGSAATLSVVASGSGTLAYQWYRDGSAISGATSASYEASVAGTYYVTVGNDGGTTTSSSAVLTVTTSVTVTAPAITSQPTSATVASGSTATFTVVASGTSLTYQWYGSSGAISGATAASYSTGTAGSYYVVVTNSAGSVTSSSVTLTISSTASGNAAVVAAAQAFVATLSTSQQASAVLGCTSTVAKNWSNLPISIGSRNGIQLSTLSSTQLAAANALLAQAFSSSGTTLIEQIRLGDEYIHLTNTSQNWGYNLYKLALLCTPSTSSTWMLQVAGHHLGYTITYNGNAVSATPVFIGTEPPNWTSSGTTYAPLDTQRAAIEALALALQADSTVAASAKFSGTYTDVTMGPTGSGDTNYPLSYPTSGRGVLYSALSSTQQALVKAAIEAYVNTVSSTVASTLLAAYESDTALAQTYVGYGVGTGGTASFAASPSGLTTQHSYLRIDGPRVWIELVVQQGVAFNTQVHYHSVWRDKTADYGSQF